MHYGDMFSMSGFSLLVLDECHYANAGHQYSTMMKRFFHTLPVEKRPHVLGLTASPLVKAKPNHTEENFLEMLQTLEETLSAKVVTYSGVNDSLTNSSLMRKAADEREVKYSPFNPVASLPSIESMKLHRTREREFQQLYQLYNDLGPLVVSIYCDRLRQEISRNAFEKESGEDFKELLDNFSRIAELCDHLSQNCPFGGRSDKLMALEELLEEQIEVNGGPETVGLVFVERRITALALMKYFHFRDSQIKKNNWNFASEARNRSPGLRMGNFSAPPAISRTVKTPYPPPDFPPLERASSQFDDAEDDIFDVSTIPQPIIVGTFPKHSSAPSQTNFVDADDPFADAEEEDDSLFEEYLSRLRYGSAIDQGVDHGDQIVGSQPIARGQPSARAESIRCQALVRNSTQVCFRFLMFSSLMVYKSSLS